MSISLKKIEEVHRHGLTVHLSGALDDNGSSGVCPHVRVVHEDESHVIVSSPAVDWVGRVVRARMALHERVYGRKRVLTLLGNLTVSKTFVGTEERCLLEFTVDEQYWPANTLEEITLGVYVSPDQPIQDVNLKPFFKYQL